MKQVRLKLFSTSTVHGSSYLAYCEDAVKQLFESAGKVLFIPYARPGGISLDDYTGIAAKKFKEFGLELSCVHQKENPIAAIKEADGIFTGGGNTFLLLKSLYDLGLLEAIETAVKKGVPYMGTSAGSNIAGLTISTTNDMPIVYPPSFESLGLVPFNLNPHYLDPDPDSTHKGETRETRIKEFHQLNDQPVIGLREGSWLSLENEHLTLEGPLKARLFRAGEEPEEMPAGAKLDFLLS